MDTTARAIDPKRLPAGETHLSDPSRMGASQIAAWIDHIHKGQKQLLDAHAVFQFKILNRGSKDEPLIQSDTQTSPHRLSTFRFTPAERRFAQRYLDNTVSVKMGSDSETRWSGLPLARSVARYRAIEQWALGSLDSWGGMYEQVADLLRDIALMEMKGPVHVSKQNMLFVHPSLNASLADDSRRVDERNG